MKQLYLSGLIVILVQFSTNVYSQTNTSPPSDIAGIGTTDPETLFERYKNMYSEIISADNNGRFVIQLAQNTLNIAPFAQPGDAII